MTARASEMADGKTFGQRSHRVTMLTYQSILPSIRRLLGEFRLVVVGHRGCAAPPKRQPRLGPIERFDLPAAACLKPWSTPPGAGTGMQRR